MAVTDNNRGISIQYFVLTEPKLASPVNRALAPIFFIIGFYQIDQFYLGGQSLKALHASLSCKYLEKGCGAVNFWEAPVPAMGKMTRGLQGKWMASATSCHKRDSSDEMQLLFQAASFPSRTEGD